MDVGGEPDEGDTAPVEASAEFVELRQLGNTRPTPWLPEVNHHPASCLRHAAAHEVSRQHPSQTGTRYEIGGPLPSPDGRAPVVRVVRFIDTGEDVPRLVTLVPSRMTRR